VEFCVWGNWTPSIASSGDGGTVYLVLDDFGNLGRCWRETDTETAADLEPSFSDLLKGEYSDPVRVIGFNTGEGWSRDISEDVASELQYRCDRQGNDVPANLERAQLRLV
jgi:hypothetical protein